MGKMYRWHNPNGDRALRMVALEQSKLGDVLELRKAREGETGDHIFNPETELADLWATMQKSGMNISANNLMLFSDQINPDTGNGEMIEADIRSEKNDEYGYAYTVKQITSFGGKHRFMLAGTFHQPVLSVGMLAYQTKSRGGKPRVARATVTRVTAPPEPGKSRQGGVQRQKAS